MYNTSDMRIRKYGTITMRFPTVLSVSLARVPHERAHEPQQLYNTTD